MSECIVDVIIPTYNRAKTLGRAIDSALNQSYKKINVIVVDDGSTDETPNLMTKYKGKVNYIRYEKNQGACHARNIGLENSQGDFVAFLDSDDAWFEDKIEKQVDFLLQNNVDVVFCSVLRIEQDKKILYPSDEKTGDIYNQLLVKNFLSNGVLLGKRECFQEKFDETLPRLQDWDIMLRISKKYKVMHQHIPLTYYYVQTDSITTNHEKLKIALEIIFEKHKDEFTNSKEACASFYKQMGVAYIMSKSKKAYKWFKLSNKFVFSVKTLILEVMCFMGLQNLIYKLNTKRLSKRYEKH